MAMAYTLQQRFSDSIYDLRSIFLRYAARGGPQSGADEAIAREWQKRWVGESALTPEIELGSKMMAAVAIMGGERLVAHQVRPAAAKLVHETDLHCLPGDPPRLLRTEWSSWIIEARRPETGERLFGDFVAMAGYRLDDGHMITLLRADSLASNFFWRPAWGEADLTAGTPYGELINAGVFGLESEKWHEWERDAVRFIVIFGLLLDAENAPLRIETEPRNPAPQKARKRRGASDWTVKHVYLNEPPRQRAAPAAPSAESAAAAPAPDERTDAHLMAVPVRGHIKRQRHGPVREQVKWIYVAGYEARRWVAPRPVKVIVGAKRDGMVVVGTDTVVEPSPES